MVPFHKNVTFTFKKDNSNEYNLDNYVIVNK